jgi:hypothetical protein
MTILQSSYGYDMTINHYYKIVKDGEKTVLLQEIGKTVSNDEGRDSGQSVADASKEIGKPFRAYKRNYRFDYRQGQAYFVSKYIAGNSANIWDGKPDYYNTWD